MSAPPRRARGRWLPPAAPRLAAGLLVLSAATLGGVIAAARPSAGRLVESGPRAAQDAQNLRPADREEAARVAVFERVAPSVVCIFADRARSGGGSGVIISPDGLGLTNFHVVAPMLESRAGFGGLSDGRLYPLRVLGVDPGGDVALFQLSGRERFDAAPLGDSDDVLVDDEVAAMGNPFMLAEDFTPTVTWGIVSGVHRYQRGQGNALEYADCIQVSSSINPGNSGGPLFNARGELVGINGRASFEERGRVNVGLGYAITINQIRRFLPALRAGRLCEHGTLGATVARLGTDLVFDAIQDASAADRGGVRLADRLLAINDRPVRSANEFLNVVTPFPAGWPLRLSVQRGEERLELPVRLERVPLPARQRIETDFAQNHAELLRLFAPYALAPRGADGADGADGAPPSIAWLGRIEAGETASSGASVRVRVVQTPAGEVRVENLDASESVRIAPRAAGGAPASAPGLPAPAAATEPAAGAAAQSTRWSDPEVWREWHDLSYPLLAALRPEPGWELIGGDELDGRICSVAERRFGDGRRVRWTFDFQTGGLLRCGIGSEADPQRVVWTALGESSSSDAWPRHWERRASGDGPALRLRIESIGPGEVAPAPSAAVGSTARGVARSPSGVDGARSAGPGASAVPVAARGPLAGAIRCAQERVVKLYGASIGREPGYGSGVLVSPDGQIATALSLMLEGRSLRAVLDDGRQFAASVLRRDDRRQLALLKIEADGLPFFELRDSRHVRTGDGIVVAGNAFKVADGDEPVSVWRGVLSGRTTLSARRRAQAHPYVGPILLVDVIVTTPGMAGAALVSAEGELIGLVGPPVISNLTNTWINGAIPVEELAAFVRGEEPEQAGAAAPAADGRPPAEGRVNLGIRLFEVGGRDKPAYVERILPDSPAREAGLRRNDLIVSVNGQLVATCDDFHRRVEALRPREVVELVVKRRDELITLRFAADGR